MQKYNGTLLRKFDDPVQGNASVGTSVVVRKKSDNSIAPIYSVDDVNSIQKPNPFTTDAFGRYSFFAPNGKYILQFGDGSDEIEISMVDNLDLSPYRKAATVAQVENGDFEIGTRLSLTDRAEAPFNVEPIGTYVVNGYSVLDAGVGKVAVYEHDLKGAWLEHLGGVSGQDVTQNVLALKKYCEDNSVAFNVGAGEFIIKEEINFDKTIVINCAYPSNYENTTGTVWIVDVDDNTKFGFTFGKNNKVISPYVNHLKFKPISPCAASMLLSAATFNGGRFIFDSNNLQYNGLLISDWYIGKIENLEGTGKTYFVKIEGNTSGVIENINAGSVGAATNDYSVQISNLVDGLLRITNIYLEAQERRNLFIGGCNKTSAIVIENIYEETQSYPIDIVDSNCVAIEKYRSNLSDKGIVVSNSKAVNIGVLPVGKFEKNPAVTVLDDSDVSVSVLQNNFSGSLTDGRDYTLIEGDISGEVQFATTANVNLTPSANFSECGFTDGTIVADVPTNKTQLVNKVSIQLNAGQVIFMPILSLRKGKRYMVRLIYKSTGEENDCRLKIANGSILKNFLSFNKSTSEFRTLSFVFEAPELQVNRYTGLMFENVSGTAIVHQFGMCEIGGGFLPSRIINDEVCFYKDIDLSVGGIIPIIDAVGPIKVSRYELQYNSASTAGSTVDVGVLTNVGTLSKFVSFSSSAKVVGQLESNMTTFVGAKDQVNAERGIAAEVIAGGTGKATLRVYVSCCDYPLAID